MKHSSEGGMDPLARVRVVGQLRFSRERSWKDSTMYSVIPTNSSFVGDGGVRCATRWPTVSVALRRPNGSAVGALQMRYSREKGSPPVSYAMTLANEKVRWHRSSWDGRGPKKMPS